MNDRYHLSHLPQLPQLQTHPNEADHQLQSESKKLKETIESLQANIKELKAEKSELQDELQDEKQRLRVEKEKSEQQVIAISKQNGILPHSPAISTAFAV